MLAENSEEPATRRLAAVVFTQNGFQSKFFKFIRKLERSGKVDKRLTDHGLRHSLGRSLADIGGDTRDIQAVLAHRTSAMAEHYCKRPLSV